MLKKRLSQKQERWAIEYIKTGNACEAVRRAYSYSKNEVIRAMSGKLVENGRVMDRVEELRKTLFDEPEKELAKVKIKMYQALEQAQSTADIVKICRLFLDGLGITGKSGIVASQVNINEQLSENDRKILGKYIPVEELNKYVR